MGCGRSLNKGVAVNAQQNSDKLERKMEGFFSLSLGVILSFLSSVRFVIQIWNLHGPEGLFKW